jgi:curli biogenesis system outer membrane secretion channel CsgG
MRIAVLDLSGSALKSQTEYQQASTTTTIALPSPSEFARGLTEKLTTALVATGKFVVLERASIEKVTGEQDFGDSGRVNRETAAAKGKIIGAQSLITGDITEFVYEQSRVGGRFKPIAALNAQADVVTAKVAIDIRLIDAVTGEVVFSRRAKGKASMTGVAADFTKVDQSFSAGASSNTPLGKASREALEQAVAAIVAGMKKVPWSGRIIDVRSGSIYINAGSDIGMQPGLELDVYEQQEPLVDPETGKKLGTPDRRIGSVVIDRVEEKYSVARSTSGDGFKRNHLLRFKGQTGKP